jgi:hypothetical protein
VDGYREICEALTAGPQRWLVTGAAGFIGSAIAERLLELGQHVVGLDNFATGHRRNVDDVIAAAGDRAARYRFVEGDICDLDTCRAACDGVDRVLHQAALGSVPRSIDEPLATHRANVDGFLNVAIAARDAGVGRLVYASSSAVYGDEPNLPKVESRIGRGLSPYAVSKRVDELYAQVIGECYGLEMVGLRYFNVFGRRQDPDGPYAAVIPRWIARLVAGEPCEPRLLLRRRRGPGQPASRHRRGRRDRPGLQRRVRRSHRSVDPVRDPARARRREPPRCRRRRADVPRSPPRRHRPLAGRHLPHHRRPRLPAAPRRPQRPGADGRVVLAPIKKRRPARGAVEYVLSAVMGG